jgi:hypothetical protein
MNRTLLVVAILAVSGISLAEAARGPTSTERSRILAATPTEPRTRHSSPKSPALAGLFLHRGAEI